MADIATFVKLADSGALILIFAVFLWIVWYYTAQLAPALKALTATVQANQVVTEKLLEGNASAFRELARSNENVSQALDLLRHSMESSEDSLAKHEQASAYNFAVATNTLTENTKAIEGLNVKLENHVTKCDTRYGGGFHHGSTI